MGVAALKDFPHQLPRIGMQFVKRVGVSIPALPGIRLLALLCGFDVLTFVARGTCRGDA